MTIAAWLFGAGGVVLLGIGAFFIFVRPSLLSEDLRFLGRSGSEIDQFLPQLRAWLRRVFVVLGGHALTVGVLTIFVAATNIRDGDGAAVVVLALAGATSIGLMAVVNFTIRSDFRWALLAASGLWVAATAAASLSWMPLTSLLLAHRFARSVIDEVLVGGAGSRVTPSRWSSPPPANLFPVKLWSNLN